MKNDSTLDRTLTATSVHRITPRYTIPKPLLPMTSTQALSISSASKTMALPAINKQDGVMLVNLNISLTINKAEVTGWLVNGVDVSKVVLTWKSVVSKF